MILFSCLFFIGASINGAGKINRVEDFTLLDYKGNKHSLSDYKDFSAILILFIATECPVSNAYNSRMEALYEEYKDKDIAFLAINSNKAEDIVRIQEHANKNNLSFTILKDEKNIIADIFDASFTPEAYVLNSDFEILYHGRIDNSRDISRVETRDLQQAIDEILSGKEVSNPETKAFGCTIKRI
jgi:peroxiredoxin